jgi:hypothetical protein
MVRWSSSRLPDQCAFKAGSLCPKTLGLGCQSVLLSRADLADALSSNTGAPYYSLFLDIVAGFVTGGSCTPVRTGKVEKDAGFARIGRLCKPKDSGACVSGATTCVKRPSMSFGSTICIYRDGQGQDCPVGWKVLKPTQYKNVVDTRDCSDCTCPANWGTDPTGSASIADYGSDSTCLTKALATATDNGETGSLPYLSSDAETRYFKVIEVNNINKPTCVPTGSAPNGGSVTGEPITICCDSGG